MAMTADDVLAVFASEAGIDPAALRPDATLAELDISSLDMISVLFELEDRFGVEIDPESIPPTATVSQLVERVLNISAS